MSIWIDIKLNKNNGYKAKMDQGLNKSNYWFLVKVTDVQSLNTYRNVLEFSHNMQWDNWEVVRKYRCQ